MKRTKRILAIAAAMTIITSAVLTGCGGNKDQGAKQESKGAEYKIAVVGPMTGDYAQYGEAFKRGTEMKAKEINDAGGVNGVKIKLEMLDDKNDPKEAANIAQKIASNKDYLAVVGNFASTACLAGAPIYQKAGIVQLSPTSSHPQFTKQGTYMFRNVNTQEIEGPIAAEYAVKFLGKKNVAIIYINNDWGITAKDYFKQGVEKFGGKIVAEETFIGGQTKDFTPTITKIRGTNPDILFLAAMYSEAGMITQQIKQLNYDIQMIGTSSLNNEQLIKLAGKSVEGMYLTSNFFPGDPSEKVKGFLTKFKNTYGADADQFAAQAYDSLGMISESLKVSGADRSKLRDALQNIKDYDGITGVTNFNENRDVIKTMVLLQVKDGKFNLVDTKK